MVALVATGDETLAFTRQVGEALVLPVVEAHDLGPHHTIDVDLLRLGARRVAGLSIVNDTGELEHSVHVHHGIVLTRLGVAQVGIEPGQGETKVGTSKLVLAQLGSAGKEELVFVNLLGLSGSWNHHKCICCTAIGSKVAIVA